LQDPWNGGRSPARTLQGGTGTVCCTQAAGGRLISRRFDMKKISALLAATLITALALQGIAAGTA
jgi:hypothetical protein